MGNFSLRILINKGLNECHTLCRFKKKKKHSTYSTVSSVFFTSELKTACYYIQKRLYLSKLIGCCFVYKYITLYYTTLREKTQ